ncbi:MAG: cation:proton antiporter [Deltaproteobacteria bacterium]|nr:cation:proton antiporter [Deltaproteobacteria bacterium]
MDPVLELLIVIAAAALGGALFERLRIPSVVGFLLTGAVVGPGGLAWIEDSERVSQIAEFGVAFLLFEIGLELPLEELRRSWRKTLLAGLLQVSITLVATALLGWAFGFPLAEAIVMGMLISLSSTALVMRQLRQLAQVDSPHGRLSLGILLFQDLCIVPFLMAIPFLSGEVPRDPASLGFALAARLAALVALFAVARFALPWVLARVAQLRSPDLFSVFAFLFAMGSAVVARELGLGLAVGAFIAGLVVGATPYRQQLFAEVAPLRGVLLGVFFTSVGMLLDPLEALAAAEGVAIYVSGVLLFKSAVIVAIVAGILREGTGTAVKTGLALAQTGEFSFALAAAATGAGLLAGDLDQIFVAGSVITLLATPFVIRESSRVASWVSGVAEGEPAADSEAVSDHVVIIGFGIAGRSIARILKTLEIPYRAVDSNPHSAEAWREQGEPIVFGDATRPSILEHVGVRRARLVSIAINDPEATLGAIVVTRALAPDVPIIARARYVEQLDGLYAAGASQVVAEEFESAIDLVSKVLRGFDIAQPAIAQFALQLREEGYELLRGPLALPIDPWLADVLEEVGADWIEVPQETRPNRSIGELGVRARTGASILAVRRRGTVHSNPSPDFCVAPGDEMLVLGSGRQVAALRALLAETPDAGAGEGS